MEAQFSKKFLLNRDFITLFFAQILACTAFQFISSLLVSYGTEGLGMDKVLVSTLSGIISLSALLFRPINSIVVDLFDRKGLFALSLLLLALSNLGVAFSEAYAWLYALQIIRGLAWAVLITSGYVLVGEIVDPSSLHTATAVFTMGQTIANVFTASLALAIVNKAGFRVAFIVGGICALFAMLLVLTIKGNHSAEDKVEKKRFTQQIRELHFHNIICLAALPMCLMHFLFQIMQSALGTAYVIAYCREGLGLLNVGIFATVGNGIMWVSRPVGGKLADKFGSRWIFILGCLGYCGASLLLGAAHNMLLVVLAACVYGVCSGAAMPILQSTLLRTVPPELAGAATSTKLIGADIGLMVGNMLMGTIAVAVGQGSYRTSYLILSVVPIIALVFILIYAFFYNRKYPDGRLGW